jgi:hypothetical protein
MRFSDGERAFGRSLKSGIAPVEQILGLFAVGNLRDGKDVDARIGGLVWRRMKQASAASRSMGFVGWSKQRQTPISAFLCPWC